jgi:uncharacterized protein involved in exopolysaccharide biosynthesis
MRRVLEICFAHRLLLIGPFIAAIVGTAGYVLIQPAAYQSSATIWVNGAGAGTQSAAQTQSDTINQLLKSDSFASAVSAGSPLGSYLDSHRDAVESFGLRSLLPGRSNLPKPSAEAIRVYLASHVTIVPVGPSELTVTVTAPTPDVAKGTADAVLSELTTEEIAVRTAPTQTLLTLYQKQLQDQTALLTNDLAAVRAYEAAHPSLATDPRLAATDAQYQTLQARVAVDEQSYSQLLGKIQQAQSDLALANQPKMAPFRIVDAPQTPSAQSLLGKQQLIALAAGLLIGVLAVAGMGALLVRLDTSIHTSEEVEPMLGLRVIGATPLSAEA